MIEGDLINKILVITAIVFIVSYIYLCLQHNHPFNQNDLINLILQVFQLTMGILIVLSIFSKDIAIYLKNKDLYLFIAGVSLIANSVKFLIKFYKKNERGKNVSYESSDKSH